MTRTYKDSASDIGATRIWENINDNHVSMTIEITHWTIAKIGAQRRWGNVCRMVVNQMHERFVDEFSVTVAENSECMVLTVQSTKMLPRWARQEIIELRSALTHAVEAINQHMVSA